MPQMTLVERLIDVRNWPASRKTTVVTACLLPLQLMLWLVAHLAASSVTIVDMALLNRLCATGVATLLIGFLASLPSTLARRQEPWTSFFFVALYYANLFYIVQALGSASTVLVALVLRVEARRESDLRSSGGAASSASAALSMGRCPQRSSSGYFPMMRTRWASFWATLRLTPTDSRACLRRALPRARR
jgi:hypothetical protein